ncbi:molecular chaperone HtpG [Inmirania thermothiophila]|uniref:Chaperone protein HtpG n=1 Tax=Inmirania thermothiophila TaxID=1750597 RepID=A0A3N1Y1Q8_9GAMM|nr:molecular chaperone HtpG [Inmirania thermothiophila]ROR32750.1 molecular chaperone HtpG [Inmirania thermothiophila]
MTVAAQRQTVDFQAEVRQVLDLVIHSLYSNKEIFLRELVSNASDACDRLRFEALGDEALYEGDTELAIRIDVDRKARTLTVTDNGIGMSREEVLENLGTIARSGTRRFLERLSGDQARDASLIGQFGVGFYSAFIVADKVTVLTRRAGLGPEHGVRWESDGEGSFTVENIERPERGTQVILHLRKGEGEFLDPERLRAIVRKYSDHIAFPIRMQAAGGDGYETVNRASALWRRPRKEISEDEYKAFYRHVAHDFDEPLAWVHSRVEGRHQYTLLLYVPRRAPFDLWDRQQRRGLKLYVRRVYITDEAERLLPAYLRFVRGVVDSDDLPLNVSREMLQEDRRLGVIRNAAIKRVLDLLERMAEKEPEKYAQFWREFGAVLKEGVIEDAANRERIAALARFASSATEGEAQTVSLDAYIERMRPGQDAIYYLTAESLAAARSSPHLEIFRRRGVEVLLLADRVDEWFVAHLPEYKGKRLRNVAQGEIDPAALGGEEAAREETASTGALEEALAKRLREALEGRVRAVRASRRLVESPACLVTDEGEISVSFGRLLKQLGRPAPELRPILEVNAAHPLVERLREEEDEGRFRELALLLYEQAWLAEGGQLEDPGAFVRRLNRLLLER